MHAGSSEEKDLARFMAWVRRDDDTGCWEFTGHDNGCGYRRFGVGGRNIYAHRWAHAQFVGPIPDGMQVGHACHDEAAAAGECAGGAGCRHRRCCNPDHLVLQTPRENVHASANTLAAIQSSRTHCPRGHALAGENLVAYDLLRGWRECRTCHNARVRARARQYRSASAAVAS